MVFFMRRHKAASILSALLSCSLSTAAPQRPAMSDAEKAILKTMSGLRGLKDADRAVVTKELALKIRALPAGQMKVNIANSLANVSTEGDFGKGTLQEVTTTLATALAECPMPKENDEPAFGYQELAQLSKYEHMNVALKSGEYDAARKLLDKVDIERSKVDFTLNDLSGRAWTLSALKGKVVLVNFWATWCPPCKKEMPDLQDLARKFGPQGFVILSISDEDISKVKPFVTDHQYSWTMLLDPGRKVNTSYHIQGIPKSFLYDRKGRLISQTIDMRTKAQFLDLLSKAGLK